MTLVFIASCASQKSVETQPKTPDVTQSISQTRLPEILSSNQQSQLFKAVSHLKNNELKPAGRILKSLYGNAKNNPQVAGNYAVVLFKQDNFDQAKKIAAAFPLDSLANNVLGLIALKELNIKQAENYFLSAIKHDSKNALAYYNVAIIYDTYHQDLPKAVQYYEAYLNLNSNDESTKTWVKELKASL